MKAKDNCTKFIKLSFILDFYVIFNLHVYTNIDVIFENFEFYYLYKHYFYLNFYGAICHSYKLFDN